MKTILGFFLVGSLLVSCKKQTGKHCPVIDQSARIATHLTDISSVSWIPEIRDTLAKYPQLQVYRCNFGRPLNDPDAYYANINCFVFYKGLIVFNEYYSLYVNKPQWDSGIIPQQVPQQPGIETEPSITYAEAGKIAEKASHYEHCQVSALGILKSGSTNLLTYKLIWRVKSAEQGYPIVDIDAQSGEVLSVQDGKMYID